MAKCIVIADDLTGANATGVLLKKMDYNTYTMMNAERLELSLSDSCDCLMYPTDSRGIDKELAYNRVYNAAKLLFDSEVKVWAKRIDSTMRGNIGAETDAILNVLGDDVIAISAPCFPESGRTVVGGYLMVNGLPLHKTSVALDPKCPVKTSNVADIFRQQSKFKVGSIKLDDMMSGKHVLAEHMKKLVNEGNRILVFDCVTQGDLDLIADALITSGLKFAAVDPGVFTATIARKLITPVKKDTKHKILALIGSVNPVTKAQVEELWLNQRTAYNVFIKSSLMLENDGIRDAEIKRVSDELLEKSSKYEILTAVGDGIYSENRIDFSKYTDRYDNTDKMTERINDAFAQIGYNVLSQNLAFKGIYSSGGDITQALCKKFNTTGLRLLDEVLPLAAYAEMMSGDFPDIKIITKGGMVGDDDAANRCITYLKEKLYM